MAPVIAEALGPSWFPLSGGGRAEIFQPEPCFPVPGTTVEGAIKQKGFPHHSSYTTAYQAHDPETWGWCRGSPVRHRDCMEKTKGHMDTLSTMKDDFRKHEYPERAQLILPKEEEMIKGRQFETSTTYNTEYTEKKPPTPPPAAKSKPRPKASAPFGTTTVQDDYKPHPDHERQPCYKPSTDYKPCRVKFDGQTTTSTAYKRWPLAKREKCKRHETTAAPPAVDNTRHISSYTADYQKPSVYGRARAGRPRREKLTLSHPSQSGGDGFPKTTQYKEQYVCYKSQPQSARPSVKQPQPNQVQRGPFSAQSVYQASYKGEPTDRAKKCVPVSENEGNIKDGNMSFVSTYRETFKGEQPPPCPTSDLINVSEGAVICDFQLVGTRKGHQMYRQVKDQKTSTSPVSTNQVNVNVKDVPSCSGDCDQVQSKANVKVATEAAKAKAEAAGQKRAAAPALPKSAKMARSPRVVDNKRLVTP